MTATTDEHHASKLKGLMWLVATIILGVFLAVGWRPLTKLVPWSWEVSLSHFLNETPAATACVPDGRSRDALALLVKRLYPVEIDDTKFSIAVDIVRDKAVNAYAQLGGKITVNAALLAQARSPEEVAGVISHEIGHVHHRDILAGTLTRFLTVQGLQIIFSGDASTTNWADYFLSMGFSRSQESAADEDGLERLQKAQIDNKGFKDFFDRMENSSAFTTFISDHPDNKSRSKMVAEYKNTTTRPIMSAEEWQALKSYCR